MGSLADRIGTSLDREEKVVSDDEKGYNGWSNYPTWAVNLWLSNDEGLYTATTDLAADHAPHALDLADALSLWVSDELAPDLGASFAADLLGYALGEVNWLEIATSWIDDLDEQS